MCNFLVTGTWFSEGGGGSDVCYIILGCGLEKCYITLYRVGGGPKKKIFALYNM